MQKWRLDFFSGSLADSEYTDLLLNTYGFVADGEGNGEQGDSSWDPHSAVDGLTSAVEAVNSSIDAWGDTLGSIWGSITSGFQSIGNGISNLWNSVSSGFQRIGEFLTDIWDSFTSVLSSLFVPSDDYWTTGVLEQIKVTFENKFQFIDGFKTAFSVMGNTQGQTLNFEFEFLGKTYAIDFSWYEAHRLTIRSAIGSLFLVTAFMKALSNILHAFGIEMSKEMDKGGH